MPGMKSSESINSGELQSCVGRAPCGHRMGSLNHFERAVIIAVVAVRMMQVAVDEIVDVVAVRHRLVAASRSMDVIFIVAAAIVAGRAAHWVCR